VVGSLGVDRADTVGAEAVEAPELDGAAAAEGEPVGGPPGRLESINGYGDSDVLPAAMAC
jgi:hypothetical protein